MRTIALFAAAATVMAVVIGILAVLEKKGDPQQPTEVAQASQAAEAASTPVSKSPSEAPTEEPTQTPTLSTTPDDTDILTVADNTDLATLLENAYECDPFPADFAKRYEGRNIEFDGYVADIAPHNSYKTRFDILIYAGTPESITGPSFQFRDVNLTYDIKQRGDYLPDNVVLGQRIHLVAKVDRFEQQSCLFLLEPVATTFLQ